MKTRELLNAVEFAGTIGIMAYVFNHDECTFTELVCEFKTESKHLKSKIKQIKKLGLIIIEKNNEKGDIKIYATKQLGFFIKKLFEQLISEEDYDQTVGLSSNDKKKSKKIKNDKSDNMIIRITPKFYEFFDTINFYIRSTAETLKKKGLL